MGKILVVDDEPNIREVMSLYLRHSGHTVFSAADGEEALETHRRERPDLVVLDLILPRMGGLEVCRRIHSERRVPLITLTAKGEEQDRALGMSVGADDYVVKPFRPRELVARVAKLLREGEAQADGAGGRVLALDGLRIDPGVRGLTVRGTPVTLAAREFDLLYVLASSPGRVFTRDQLLEAVWDHEFTVEPTTITAYVRRLREKIEADPERPRHLHTVWGVGYRFDAG